MPVRQVRLCLVGFGKTGRALAEMILDEHDRLVAELGFDLVVTGISTARFGSVTDPNGIDLRAALARASTDAQHGPSVSSVDFVATCPADIVVETTPLEPLTGELGIAITRAALSAGRSVVSANKGPVAHGLRELKRLAHGNGVHYRYESAVADGLPVFSLVERTLPGASITAMTGMLNSTSGIVLESLSRGVSMSVALEEAGALGILEDDPRYDLDGWDAAVKLCALSATIWDEPIRIEEVVRTPVSEAFSAPAIAAHERGHRLVSMASIRRTSPDVPVQARVDIIEIGPDSVFFPLTGTSLGIQFESRLLSPVTISCSEPRLSDTAYGLLADVLHIGRDDAPSRSLP
jgi:homoserine dehydrogenase